MSPARRDGFRRGCPGARQNVAAWPDRAHVLSPAIAVAVILVLDAVQFGHHWSVPVSGLLDEPAHLLTAALGVCALRPGAERRAIAWVLLGSVVIDVDHVPLYAGWHEIAAAEGRPVTHSLATVLALLCASTSPRLRTPACGLAVGVLLHLARDAATGPGVPVLWPATNWNLLVPYYWYAAALALSAMTATLHVARRRITVP